MLDIGTVTARINDSIARFENDNSLFKSRAEVINMTLRVRRPCDWGCVPPQATNSRATVQIRVEYSACIYSAYPAHQATRSVADLSTALVTNAAASASVIPVTHASASLVVVT